ncbi:cytochrome c oxidase assembly protein [Salinactinospora qingdaonensis]|uniref:Cytochrome c oxidase assembly protein n=1 Tax=Salinactinospora qingdaonensis TaxID=702744 RepID=A0ABP7FCK5_9ACTN
MASPDLRETETSTPPRDGAIAELTVAAVAICAISLLLALLAGGSVVASVAPGLPDPGPLTRWGLPISTAGQDIAAALTLGLLLLTVVLLPSQRGALTAAAQSYLRATSWFALAWAALSAGTLIFTLSDLLGLPPSQVLDEELTSYAGSVGQGIALMVVILAATGVALFARVAQTATAALGVLGLGLLAQLPPLVAGHAASAANHSLAVTGLAVHVLAAIVWVGGLAALTYHALRASSEHVPVAVERFSRLALWAYVGVAVGGVAISAARLTSVTELFTTPYGWLIAVKSALFVVLGYLGWQHRRRTVPRIVEGTGRVLFARIAAVEVAIMAAVMGVAAALSQTEPPPVPTSPPGTAADILGFPMPPPISAQTILTLWRPDLFFILVVVVLGGLYAAGVVRLLRRGDHWPWGRTIAWFCGLLTIVATVLTGVGTYSMVLFSTHMIQHMVLSMMTPILLVLGAPMTLALRALHPARRRGDRGPREWLTLFLNSRFSRLVTHHVFATVLFIASTYALYFTPLFELLMSDHLGHVLMNTHFILAGFLYYWVIVGIDPAPRKVPYMLRIVLLLATMGFHAFFGIAIMMQSAPMGMAYYSQFDVPWLASIADDQYAGGGIAWAVGEIPTLMVLIALVGQWWRDEERTERRRERHSRRDGSDDADMDAYNAYLQALDRRARQQR